MDVDIVKKLIETYSVEKLIEAEKDLIYGHPIKIKIEGDESQKLTHMLAAIWVLEKMKSFNVDFKQALLEYSKQVREVMH